MSDKALFLDTVFIQATLNRRDQYHQQAQLILPRVRAAREVWTTEAILIEVGNAMSGFNRQAAAAFIRQCYQTANLRVIAVDWPLLERALTLYETREDKRWGLTDCISFVVMKEQNLTTAVTADRHFIQAGFDILL